MPDLLQSSSDWLTGMLKANVSQAVTFRRGAATVVVQATLGSTEWTSETTEGIAETWESRDFLVTAADLVLAGQRVEPTVNDKLEHTFGGTKFTYEVLAQPGVKSFSYCDPNRVAMRIHTKLVGTGIAP